MKAKLGVALVIIAFLVSLYPYLVIYVWVVYLLGVVLIWLSDLKVMAKAMWTFLPIAFWYPAMLLFYALLGALAKV